MERERRPIGLLSGRRGCISCGSTCGVVGCEICDKHLRPCTPCIMAALSWAPVATDSREQDPKFTINGLRFATYQEAKQWAMDLTLRWLGCRDVSVIPTRDPVTHQVVEGVVEPVEQQEGRR